MTAIAPCPAFDRGSFRDRSGRVFSFEGRVFRAISQSASADWDSISAKTFFVTAMQSGRVVQTERSPSMDSFAKSEGFAAALEHERLPLISWPYEWSFSMLREAALLQLDLMNDCLADGFILKDASAFNVQFRGSRPQFIDVGSMVPYVSGQTWDGYRQFCQMMLFPLMLQAWKGVHFQPALRGSLEGIAPDQFAALLGVWDFFRRGALTHVWLHARLQAKSPSQVRISQSMQRSGFGKSMILNNVKGLRKAVAGLQWKPSASTWSDYDQSSEPVLRDGAVKESFIENVCRNKRYSVVWDLGCNQGRYSRIAARTADVVLATDSDHLTIDRLYQSLRSEDNRNIVPLVVDLADPSPALGWRGAERPGLEQRSKPNLIFCLALIHHLVIGKNLLLREVIEWLASFNADVVIEFVERDDAQVRELLRNREDVFSDYCRQSFLQSVNQHFEIQNQRVLPSGTRTLFLLKPQ